MIALTIAGASHTAVTRDRSSSSTTLAASNTRWMTVVAPAAMSDVVVRSSAPTWYSGPHARPRSASENPNSTTCARFFQARFACVSMTPLGRPVVPDVYMSRWTSSASATTGGGATAPRSQLGQRRPPAVVRLRDAGPYEGFLHARGRIVGQIDQRGVADQGAGARVLEDVAHLRCRQPPVDRHGDGAQTIGGEDRLEESGQLYESRPTTSPGARRARATLRPVPSRRAAIAP